MVQVARCIHIIVQKNFVIHFSKLAQRDVKALLSLSVSCSFGSYTFDTQILCNDDSRLLSNSYRIVISISSYVGWSDTAVWIEEKYVNKVIQKTDNNDNY